MQNTLKVLGILILMLIGSFHIIVSAQYSDSKSDAEENGYDEISAENEDSEELLETKKSYYTRTADAHQISSYTHILHRGSVICAGALTTYDVVITSSHCLRSDDLSDKIKAKDLFVRMGNTIGSKACDESLLRVKEVLYPPGKKDEPTIVLLILKEQISSKNIRPLALCSASPKVGDALELVFVNTLDYQLEIFNSKALPLGTCSKIYEGGDIIDVPLDDNSFCAANKKKSLSNTCHTRIGDPLLVGSKLCGINLYGEQCLEHEGLENADVYVDVFKMRDFVNRKSARTYTVVS